MDPFRDEEVQRELLAMTIWDRSWLGAVGDLITPEDFLPVSRGTKTNSWIVASLTLPFFHNHRTPVGSLLGQELSRWLKESGASAARKEELIKYLKGTKAVYDPSRSEILKETVIEFKRHKQRQRALRDLIELDEAGQLTDDKWQEITTAAMHSVGLEKTKDYIAGLELRQIRRQFQTRRRIPVLMIDPLDAQIQAIARGHLGLWLAYYKMGKSLALIYTATSYLFQGLNVLYFTLEDPVDDVEDRMDGCITQMLLEELSLDPGMVTTRFENYRDKLTAGLRIVDGTEGGLSIGQMESVWERLRSEGFDADVVIVDYDDEIRPPLKRSDRRQEFADIYRQFREFVARRKIYGWTAAQAVRGAEGKEIIKGSDTAEDISKIRKVTLAIGIGQGEWGKDSRALNIIAHKFDDAGMFSTIWTDPARGLFYDRDRTLAEIQKRRKTVSNGNGVH